MSKIQVLSRISLLAIVLFASACKYELGPFISFLTEEARISRSWKFEKVLHNKVQVTTGSYDSVAYVTSFLGFDKNGRFSLLEADLHFGRRGSTLYDGGWEFEDDKKNLILNYDNASKGTKKYRILQLTEKNLSFKSDENGNVTEYFLIPNIK
jgi:hypothetical protein